LLRVVLSIERHVFATPAPEPRVAPAANPTPAPIVTPAHVAVATPKPAFSAAATPEPVDPIAWLISNKSRWPRELALTETVEFPATYGGNIVGSIKAPASSTVSVTGITPDDVEVVFMGGSRRLPHKATNLAELAKAAMEGAQTESSQPAPLADQTPAGETQTPRGDLAAGGPFLPVKTNALDAWTAVGQMTPGINIGNTFDNVVHWETGWGSPLITKEYIRSLARVGFKSVRLPVSWDTFADNGRITPQEFQRINQVADWIIGSGMFCVINIHWDGGWIDSDVKERFPTTYHTFSPEAEKKFRSYWEQISRFFADKNEKLIFEALNEESDFENEGSTEKAYAALTRVNQLFIDTVRSTGGNNAHRLLIISGCSTDIDKTCQREYRLPKDMAPGLLFVSIHYYVPWLFVGLDQDASWGKVQRTWGTHNDVKQLNDLFDKLNDFCTRNNTPAFIGEFSMCSRKETASSVRWTTSVFHAALKRRMVPVLWDTGGAVSRVKPYAPTDELADMLSNTGELPGTSVSASK